MRHFVKRQLEKSFIAALASAKTGSITVRDPQGKVTRYGSAAIAANSNSGIDADLTVHDWSWLWPVAMKGDIGLAETYIEGLWDTSSIENLIAFFLTNMDAMEKHAHGHPVQQWLFRLVNHVVRRNNRKGSRANIHAHYDVGNDFYKLWLDKTMTYSSALYKDDGTPLENAQKAKYQRILERLESGVNEILEIGCGWGGFAEEAAAAGKQVTAVTVSQAQHKFATERLQGKADIRLQDYRDVRGKFSGIVSIEMFEAVGERYWPAYFRTIKNRLAEGGKAIIQTITIDDKYFNEYKKRSDFIRHYIFPGGLLPGVSRFKDEAAKAGLVCSEPFSFGQDYARTLREWLSRFDAAKEEMERMGYNQQFQRSWRFYLAMCAAAFAVNRTDVVQFELSHAA